MKLTGVARWFVVPAVAFGVATAGLAVSALELNPEAEGAAAQYWRRRVPPRFPDPQQPLDGSFVFCRILYQSVRSEAGGQGWYTDYPDGDMNFMSRLEELTEAHVSRGDGGYPNHVVVTLYDDELFDYPFVFMSDVGTVGFDSVEVERLRTYLLRGGFLWVDDFWGRRAWDAWSREIGKVLPPDEYPILDVEPGHPIYRMMYNVDELPQIPSIQWWRRSGGYTTSERGWESETPHLRAISDKDGRILVLMSHNTDIADGWERENEEYEFFHRFSADSYAVGINVVLYAMAH